MDTRTAVSPQQQNWWPLLARRKAPQRASLVGWWDDWRRGLGSAGFGHNAGTPARSVGGAGSARERKPACARCGAAAAPSGTGARAGRRAGACAGCREPLRPFAPRPHTLRVRARRRHFANLRRQEDRQRDPERTRRSPHHIGPRSCGGLAADRDAPPIAHRERGKRRRNSRNARRRSSGRSRQSRSTARRARRSEAACDAGRRRQRHGEGRRPSASWRSASSPKATA